MNISDLSRLTFFMVGKYEYAHENICDFSGCPRPHFCMGLIMEGEGVFSSESDCDGEVLVVPGDIIFVPMGSRYVSTWRGKSKISYTSMHFAFEGMNLFPERQSLKIQKVTLPDFHGLKKSFEYSYQHYNGDLASQLTVLGIFYDILGRVEPRLKRTKQERIDKRIEKAMEYIQMNSEKSIQIPLLADLCNMSVSHFYFCFRSEVGMTPVEYKNLVCINRAMRLLISDYDKSIEEISETLGFYSSTYFRRVFKRITGKTPSAYRKTAAEL